jgi:hypothetical protein
MEEERQWPPTRSRVVAVAIIVSFVASSLIGGAAIIWAVVDDYTTAPWGLVFAPLGVFIGGIAAALPSIMMALLLQRLKLKARSHLVVSMLLGAAVGGLFAWPMFHGEPVLPAFTVVFAAAGMVSGWIYHRMIYAHR